MCSVVGMLAMLQDFPWLLGHSMCNDLALCLNSPLHYSNCVKVLPYTALPNAHYL